MSASIGYLLKKFPRLSETFVLGEILAQEALGQQLVVYSRREVDDEPRHPEFAQLKAPIVQVPTSSTIDPFALLLEGSGQEPALLELLGDVLKRLRPLNVLRLPKLVGEALWVLQDARERGLRHLHVHFATESAIVAHLVHALGGPSYSITAHAKDIYRSTVDARLLERLVRDSQFTITVCDANVAHMAESLSAEAMQRVRRHYNGIDQLLHSSLERRPAMQRILSIGRLVEKKGFDTLLLALEELARRGIEFEAEVIGDGDQREALQARASQGPLADKLRFLGALPADRVREHLARATVFVLPCRVGEDGNRDALPTVLLEAQAVGVPLISSPVGGVAEILDHGRAGLLVPSNDPNGLADCIAGALTNPARLVPLVEHGKHFGQRHFDRARQAETLFSWFQTVLLAEGHQCASLV